MTSCSVSRKHDTELGHAPTSQARPRDTGHLRPSKLAASTLRSVEHTPSKFGHDPCPVKRGLVATVKCCVRKARFFSLSGQAVELNKRSQRLVWVSTPQRAKPVFILCFPIPQLSALRNQKPVFLFGDFPSSCGTPREVRSVLTSISTSFLCASQTQNVLFAHSSNRRHF